MGSKENKKLDLEKGGLSREIEEEIEALSEANSFPCPLEINEEERLSTMWQQAEEAFMMNNQAMEGWLGGTENEDLLELEIEGPTEEKIEKEEASKEVEVEMDPDGEEDEGYDFSTNPKEEESEQSEIVNDLKSASVEQETKEPPTSSKSSSKQKSLYLLQKLHSLDNQLSKMPRSCRMTVLKSKKTSSFHLAVDHKKNYNLGNGEDIVGIVEIETRNKYEPEHRQSASQKEASKDHPGILFYKSSGEIYHSKPNSTPPKLRTTIPHLTHLLANDSYILAATPKCLTIRPLTPSPSPWSKHTLPLSSPLLSLSFLSLNSVWVGGEDEGWEYGWRGSGLGVQAERGANNLQGMRTGGVFATRRTLWAQRGDVGWVLEVKKGGLVKGARVVKFGQRVEGKDSMAQVVFLERGGLYLILWEDKLYVLKDMLVKQDLPVSAPKTQTSLLAKALTFKFSSSQKNSLPEKEILDDEEEAPNRYILIKMVDLSWIHKDIWVDRVFNLNDQIIIVDKKRGKAYGLDYEAALKSDSNLKDETGQDSQILQDLEILEKNVDLNQLTLEKSIVVRNEILFLETDTDEKTTLKSIKPIPTETLISSLVDSGRWEEALLLCVPLYKETSRVSPSSLPSTLSFIHLLCVKYTSYFLDKGQPSPLMEERVCLLAEVCLGVGQGEWVIQMGQKVERGMFLGFVQKYVGYITNFSASSLSPLLCGLPDPYLSVLILHASPSSPSQSSSNSSLPFLQALLSKGHHRSLYYLSLSTAFDHLLKDQKVLSQALSALLKNKDLDSPPSNVLVLFYLRKYLQSERLEILNSAYDWIIDKENFGAIAQTECSIFFDVCISEAFLRPQVMLNQKLLSNILKKVRQSNSPFTFDLSSSSKSETATLQEDTDVKKFSVSVMRELIDWFLSELLSKKDSTNNPTALSLILKNIRQVYFLLLKLSTVNIYKIAHESNEPNETQVEKETSSSQKSLKSSKASFYQILKGFLDGGKLQIEGKEELVGREPEIGDYFNSYLYYFKILTEEDVENIVISAFDKYEIEFKRKVEKELKDKKGGSGKEEDKGAFSRNELEELFRQADNCELFRFAAGIREKLDEELISGLDYYLTKPTTKLSPKFLASKLLSGKSQQEKGQMRDLFEFSPCKLPQADLTTFINTHISKLVS